MASLCRQCAMELFGSEGKGDFVGFTSQWMWDSGMARFQWCENCGGGLVDPDGYCMGSCNKKHNRVMINSEGNTHSVYDGEDWEL